MFFKLFRLRNLCGLGPNNDDRIDPLSTDRVNTTTTDSKKHSKSSKFGAEMKKTHLPATASELKDEGNKYFALHRFDEAIVFYSKAIVSTFGTLFNITRQCND